MRAREGNSPAGCSYSTFHKVRTKITKPAWATQAPGPPKRLFERRLLNAVRSGWGLSVLGGVRRGDDSVLFLGEAISSVLVSECVRVGCKQTSTRLANSDRAAADESAEISSYSRSVTRYGIHFKYAIGSSRQSQKKSCLRNKIYIVQSTPQY